MKTKKKENIAMRISAVIIMLFIGNGIWAQNAILKNPKFKVGQTATYEFTLEQKQSGEPDSINTMLDFTQIARNKDYFFGYKEMQEPYLSCKIRLKVLNVTPHTTTMQVDLLESVNYSNKKVESFGDSLMYYKLNDIFKNCPLILTFSSDMKEYVISNGEEAINKIYDILWNNIQSSLRQKREVPSQFYNNFLQETLSLMNGRNIDYTMFLYFFYAPSLLDLIQTFATEMKEGTTTEGKPLDGTNRYMSYLTTKTTKNKKGEWTYLSDFSEYVMPTYHSDLEEKWESDYEVDSAVIDTMEADYNNDIAEVDTAVIDSSYYDTTEWDSVEIDSVEWVDSLDEYKPDSTLNEEDREANTHREIRIGKDYWPIEISKTITLEDKNIVWTYRRKIKRVENK
ncbi:hypothetical protein HMPREF0653_00772 [Prevotella disiens JCM 6334 = ATCC 29426]|uniref:Uncharacterized protein n=2 Tax=Prevotella disiens TaxID=28130 RepID=A0A379DYQ5_9BACT|nr:hypothetical protein [Prevotella disiens]ERJ78769.1 hypothetical protein HMPREF0653_00772 [Prevotella disiens JCM 6334 = ATCC 29426]SUB85204.1 Uncharacterised protein [Prevotella disiens]